MNRFSFMFNKWFYLGIAALVLLVIVCVGFAFPVWYTIGHKKKSKDNTPTCDVTGYYYYGKEVTKNYNGTNGYYYPLYLSETEAKIADTCNGGDGQAHQMTFESCDDVFWMPSTSKNHATSFLKEDYKDLKELKCSKKKTDAYFIDVL